MYSLIAIISILVAVVVMAFAPKMFAKHGKRNVLLVFAVVGVVGGIIGFVGAKQLNPILVFVSTALHGASLAPYVAAIFTFASDIVEYDACPQDNTCPIWPFTDASTTAWYHDGVHYCIDEGLMEGYGNGLFGPNDTLSRAQLCQILYNMEGQPAVTGESAFTDVADGAWYFDAVTWAASEGIATGYGDGTYGPDDSITREQLAAILYRYASYKGYDVSVGEDTNILSYADALDVSEWAIPAMQWACGSGVIEGVTDSTLVPQGNATRAQAATMLMRFCETVAK